VIKLLLAERMILFSDIGQRKYLEDCKDLIVNKIKDRAEQGYRELWLTLNQENGFKKHLDKIDIESIMDYLKSEGFRVSIGGYHMQIETLVVRW